MDDLVQQDGEIEYREAGDHGARQPEVPVLEVNDGNAGERERREIRYGHDGVQQRPLLMQLPQGLRRHFSGKVTLELPRMLVVVGRHDSWKLTRNRGFVIPPRKAEGRGQKAEVDLGAPGLLF